MNSSKRLFVLYTNWKGRKAWREIEPDNGELKIQIGRYIQEDGSSEETFVLHVSMPDRDGARRSLKVSNIHAFHVGEESPQ